MFIRPPSTIFVMAQITLNHTLSIEGQTCSFCFAIVSLEANKKGLNRRERAAYGKHLQRDHGLKPYGIDR